MKTHLARRLAPAISLICLSAAAQDTALPASAASPAPTAPAASAAAPADPGRGYKVIDGYYVDDFTLEGFRTWRAAACDRCHGANQQGLVGPSLVDSLKTLSKADFVTTLTNGRLEKGMPSWASNPTVMTHIDSLYAYLKGRSDGAITRSHVEPMSHAPSASASAQ